MKHYTYIIRNKLNGKIYIGSRSHVDPINDSYMGSGKALRYAFNKYGISYFSKRILRIFSSVEEARLSEEFILQKYDAQNNTKFYNMKNVAIGGSIPGSNLGRKLTKEHKLAISKACSKPKHPGHGPKLSKTLRAEHHLAKRIQTPFGMFNSVRQAEENTGIDRRKLRKFMLDPSNKDYYEVSTEINDLSLTK